VTLDAQLRQLHADLKAVLDGLDNVIVYRVDGPATLTREVWATNTGTSTPSCNDKPSP